MTATVTPFNMLIEALIATTYMKFCEVMSRNRGDMAFTNYRKSVAMRLRRDYVITADPIKKVMGDKIVANVLMHNISHGFFCESNSFRDIAIFAIRTNWVTVT